MVLISIRDLFAEADLRADEVGGDFAAEAFRLGKTVAVLHRELAGALGTGTADTRSMSQGMLERLDAALPVVPELADLASSLRAAFEGVGQLASRCHPADPRRPAPRPDAAHPEGLAAARLRGRAGPPAGRAPRARGDAARRGRHAALVRLRGVLPARRVGRVGVHLGDRAAEPAGLARRGVGQPQPGGLLRRLRRLRGDRPPGLPAAAAPSSWTRRSTRSATRSRGRRSASRAVPATWLPGSPQGLFFRDTRFLSASSCGSTARRPSRWPPPSPSRSAPSWSSRTRPRVGRADSTAGDLPAPLHRPGDAGGPRDPQLRRGAGLLLARAPGRGRLRRPVRGQGGPGRRRPATAASRTIHPACVPYRARAPPGAASTWRSASGPKVTATWSPSR
jgi:hypothetical protein